MAPLNEALKGKICVYCANCVEGKCAAGVPWYLSSIYCKYFAEEALPMPVKKTRKVNVRRYLVETF
ncbi:MAG: hypothetical protein LBU85_08985 [Treponema sp.]|jgi:hypothetical protein|nr:hypothetical protein [Treponema sp.]